MVPTLIESAADGSLNTLMPIPEEMAEATEGEGIVIRVDRYGVIESTVWKENDGKLNASGVINMG